MLSTQTASTTDTVTSSVRIKTLNAPKARDEQKDLEQDFESEEEPAVNEDHVQSLEQSDSEIVTFSGLSSRASEIKNHLQQKSEVKAIVLKHDGSVQEISYDTSSAGTRQVLSGRPSVVGTIEELNLIVLQSVELSDGDAVNKHTLPVPLCHHLTHGHYLLFRVDSEGKASDISMDEYQKYVDDHQTLTETAIKNYNNDEEPIPSRSPFRDQSVDTLRGALETQIWSESDDVHLTQLSDAELQKSVKEGLQKYVDEVVAQLTASPMEDPDYNPEDDRQQQPEQQQEEDSVPSHTFKDEPVDERSWREQLDDALEHVHNIGLSDGAVFAERILSTFEELRGEAPALDDVADLYSRIRTDFANEAEEELDDDEQSESEAESGSEAESESEIENAVESENEVDSEGEVDGDEWEEALDIVRALGQQDGESLAEEICDILEAEYGSLTLEGLTEIWMAVQEVLAAEAEEEDESESDSEDDDSDYDPDNLDDQIVAEQDAADSAEHEIQHFESDSDYDSGVDEDEWEEALDHIRCIAQIEGEELAGDIVDFLCESNGEMPSLEELTEIWVEIQDQLIEGEEEESDDEEEYDPDNLDDQYLAEQDAVEDFIHNTTYFEEVECNEGDLEMEEALDHIRGIAREDGQALAENIVDILCEVNQEAPSLEELTAVWESIQDELVEEAQREMDESADEEEEEEDLSPVDTLRFSAKMVAADWESRAFSLYLNQKGRAPTEEELLSTIREFAAELADSVLMGLESQSEHEDESEEEDSEEESGADIESESESQIESEVESEDEVESEIESEEEIDGDDWEEALDVARALGQHDGEMLAEEICDILEAEYGEEASLEALNELWLGIQEQLVEEAEEGADDDSDYDPDNMDDQDLAEQDFAESQEHESRHFEAEVFGQSESGQEEEGQSLDEEYDPDNTVDLVQARWDLEAEIKFDELHYDRFTLNTPIVQSKTGNGVSWNVYFDEADLSLQAESENLQKAADAFRIFNHEAPSIAHLKHLADFLSAPNDRSEDEWSAPSVVETEVVAATKVLVSPVAEKKTAKRFNVYLGDSKLSQEESEQIAVKWCKRFNGGQEPSEEDLAKIQAFIQQDAELTEQEFLIPVKKLHFQDQEEEQKSEEEEGQEQGDEDEDTIDIE